MRLKPYFVKPAKTFFYWGWTIPKEHYDDLKKFFDLNRRVKKSTEIVIKFKNKKYSAKINYTRINNTRKYKRERLYPERDVLRIQYDNEYDLIRELKKSFTYSFVTNFQKRKTKLSELISFVHEGDNVFKIKPYVRQETEYDDMFREMIDRGLFSFIDSKNKKKVKDSIFLKYDERWHDISELKEFQNRYNVIYLLHHSEDKHVYVGQAKDFKNRVIKGKGREGLAKDWDKFMCFELNPDFAYLLNDIETFAIRFMASVMTNDVKIKSLLDTKLKLVNRHKRNTKK